MKRVIVFLVLFLLVVVVVKAQKLSLGCKGDLDFVNIRFNPQSENMGFTQRMSYDAGLIANYKPLEFFQIQIESSFIEKGAQLKFKYVDEKWILKYGYISNQLVLIVKPTSWLNLEVGSELGHILYAKKLYIPGEETNERLSDYKRNDFSGLIGVGINLFKNSYINCRYVYGFTPFQECLVLVDPGPSYSYLTYNKYFSIGLRYYFLNIK